MISGSFVLRKYQLKSPTLYLSCECLWMCLYTSWWNFASMVSPSKMTTTASTASEFCARSRSRLRSAKSLNELFLSRVGNCEVLIAYRLRRVDWIHRDHQLLMCVNVLHMLLFNRCQYIEISIASNRVQYWNVLNYWSRFNLWNRLTCHIWLYVNVLMLNELKSMYWNVLACLVCGYVAN